MSSRNNIDCAFFNMIKIFSRMNLISSIVVSSSADFMYNDSFDQKMQTEVWEAVSNRVVSRARHGMAQRGTWSSILSKVWES